MPLHLFPQSDIFTILVHKIFSLKPRKALIYWTFQTLTLSPLLSIRPSQRVILRLFGKHVPNQLKRLILKAF
jgi:hypothetical protein